MSFFHGIKVTDVNSGDIIITQRGAGVIGLVGVSPYGPTVPTLVSNSTQASAYGPSVFDGRTIPQALAAILAQGTAQVLVINVFVAGTHNATITAETKVVAADLTLTLTQIPFAAPVITNSDASTTLVRGVDYTWDDNTKIVKIINPTTYPAATSLKVTYSWFNSALVIASAIVGANTSGVRTGTFQFELAYAMFGILPKILIAPGFSTTTSVSDALLVQAEKLRARVIIDAPGSTNIAAAIALRGGSSNFNSSNNRLIGVYPKVYISDTFGGGADQLWWYSAYFAGLWANAVNSDGIQYSPSNRVIKGINNTEVQVSATPGDANSDANQLNAAGINTVFSGFATGYKSWGNRSFAFPSSAAFTTFMSVQMVRDILDESVMLAALPLADQPLNLSFIDTVKNAVNLFINSLILSQALIDGSCTFDPGKNPPDQLALGKVKFTMSYLPPGPAEEIDFDSFIDISLFSNLLNQ